MVHDAAKKVADREMHVMEWWLPNTLPKSLPKGKLIVVIS
jgi:hypothetical protein